MCPAGCTAPRDSDCSSEVDTAGVWFTKVSAPGTLTAANGQLTSESTVSAWIRLHISPTGGLTLNVCKLTVTGESTFGTTYPPALIKTLQTTAQFTGSTRMSLGTAVQLPVFTIYSGQSAAGVSIDAVPPPFPGGDGDGNDGVTIPSTVKIGSKTSAIDIYSGLVITTKLNGLKLATASTITGELGFTTQGVVFGSTNRLLVSPGTTFEATTTAPTVAFTATKLDSDGSHDCASIAGL